MLLRVELVYLRRIQQNGFESTVHVTLPHRPVGSNSPWLLPRAFNPTQGKALGTAVCTAVYCCCETIQYLIFFRAPHRALTNWGSESGSSALNRTPHEGTAPSGGDGAQNGTPDKCPRPFFFLKTTDGEGVPLPRWEKNGEQVPLTIVSGK